MYINDERVQISQWDAAVNDAWVGSIRLDVGTTISFRFGDDPSMDFEVIADPRDDETGKDLHLAPLGAENDKENNALAKLKGPTNDATPQKPSRLESE